jgi:hypothetical protein
MSLYFLNCTSFIRKGSHGQGEHHLRGASPQGEQGNIPFCHCCQRGRMISKIQLRLKRGFTLFPSMPKGENVGHGGMVLALMSKKANMINVGHGIMVLALMSRRSIWYFH